MHIWQLTFVQDQCGSKIGEPIECVCECFSSRPELHTVRMDGQVKVCSCEILVVKVQIAEICGHSSVGIAGRGRYVS